MTMKQPREDVTGTAREDDLLSLDVAAVTHRDALISMAQLLSSACLVGHPAPIVERMGERIRKPQAGDLVIEVSAMRSRDPDKRITGFGTGLSGGTPMKNTQRSLPRTRIMTSG
jgi:hypothetical protein